MAEVAIRLKGISKRFQYNWIFRDINFEFVSGNPVAIVGPNGSGKSTLMQMIAGFVSPSEGKLVYELDNRILQIEDVFRYISMTAPSLELIEEMKLREMLNFHFRFNQLIDGTSLEDIIERLKFSPNKEIRNYSSGMKQRLKLAIAFFTDSQILLLDEPTTNLDQAGQEWYNQLVENFTKNRLVIVSSNQPKEYEFCDLKIDLGDYK